MLYFFRNTIIGFIRFVQEVRVRLAVLHLINSQPRTTGPILSNGIKVLALILTFSNHSKTRIIAATCLKFSVPRCLAHNFKHLAAVLEVVE